MLLITLRTPKVLIFAIRPVRNVHRVAVLIKVRKTYSVNVEPPVAITTYVAMVQAPADITLPGLGIVPLAKPV